MNLADYRRQCTQHLLTRIPKCVCAYCPNGKTNQADERKYEATNINAGLKAVTGDEVVSKTRYTIYVYLRFA